MAWESRRDNDDDDEEDDVVWSYITSQACRSLHVLRTYCMQGDSDTMQYALHLIAPDGHV